MGTNVDATHPMPADGAIQIAFDRYLLPSTVNRGSFGLLNGANQRVAPDLLPVVTYDPITRTVTLLPPKQPWLTEGQPYKLVLGIPDGDADEGGVRAIDRATLFPGQTREFAFIVGPKKGLVIAPTVSFCRDVLPIFAAKCSVGTCHGNGDRAAASLVLQTSTGVSATALGRLAQGSNRGPRAGLVSSSERLFGVDMPIVDPGNPGNSWLMYKVDLPKLPDPPQVTPVYSCTNAEAPATFAFTPLVGNAQRTADDVERGILSNYILGREMPFPVPSPGGYEDLPLTFEEREKVRLWIQSLPPGQGVPECGGCGVSSTPDGGAGGTSEAGIAAGGTDAGITDAADP